jgi:hypothetical protein
MEKKGEKGIIPLPRLDTINGYQGRSQSYFQITAP